MRVAPLYALLFSVVFLNGCATTNRQSSQNPFQEYYQSALAALPSTERQRVEVSLEPHFGPCAIISTTNLKDDVDALMEKNYAPLGVSDFHGPMQVTQKQLADFAAKVGADRVLFYREHQYDENRVRRERRRESEAETTTTGSGALTSHSQGTASATATGSRGWASANGSFSSETTADYTGRQTSTTTTYRNQYVPYAVGHYGYVAIYWRHRKPPVFGALSGELTSEQRAALQRNTGAVVRYVVSDSPAFNANILKGDLIVGVNGIPINSPTDLNNRLETMAGQNVKIGLVRAERTLEVDVRLNSAPTQLTAVEPLGIK